MGSRSLIQQIHAKDQELYHLSGSASADWDTLMASHCNYLWQSMWNQISQSWGTPTLVSTLCQPLSLNSEMWVQDPENCCRATYLNVPISQLCKDLSPCSGGTAPVTLPRWVGGAACSELSPVYTISWDYYWDDYFCHGIDHYGPYTTTDILVKISDCSYQGELATLTFDASTCTWVGYAWSGYFVGYKYGISPLGLYSAYWASDGRLPCWESWWEECENWCGPYEYSTNMVVS